jgi:sigma-B regulation protein RsbU (phosphoserine phosphatase)
MMAEKTQQQIERDGQIYQLTTLVAGDFSLQEVLDKLAEAAVKITGVKACSIRLLDEETGDLKMRSTYGLSEEYRSKGPVSKDDPVIRAAFAGKPVVLDDMRVDDRVRYKEATVKEGLVSQLTVAMQFRSKPIGVLRLYRRQLQPFDRDDVALARAVASQCAVAITNARLYTEAIEGQHMAEQMRLAGIIQRRMIPERAPVMAALDVAATYIPCFEVGGDFYDFLQPDEHSLRVVIADVIGKGLPAAMMMSSFRATLRAYADTTGGQHSLAEIVTLINRAVCQYCREGEFITMLIAELNTQTMRTTYCNCGHEQGVLVRNQHTIDLDKGGVVLGLMENAHYTVGTVELKDGDCLLFYTDGLIDAANFQGELWGRDRLVETVQNLADGPAEQTVKNILRYRRRFVGLATQFDDTSIVVAKVDRTARPQFMKELNV